jgi:hypothetical protein
MTEEKMLHEACKLLEECFDALGDYGGFKRAAPELLEWWRERKPPPRKPLPREHTDKIQIYDKNNLDDVAKMAAARAKRTGQP